MIGSLVLDQFDRYLVNGKLPSRPYGDKELLQYLVSISNVPDLTNLPPSMRKPPEVVEFTLATRIKDIAKSNLLIINRSYDSREIDGRSSIFRLDEHQKIGEVELWGLKSLMKEK